LNRTLARTSKGGVAVEDGARDVERVGAGAAAEVDVAEHLSRQEVEAVRADAGQHVANDPSIVDRIGLGDPHVAGVVRQVERDRAARAVGDVIGDVVVKEADGDARVVGEGADRSGEVLEADRVARVTVDAGEDQAVVRDGADIGAGIDPKAIRIVRRLGICRSGDRAIVDELRRRGSRADHDCIGVRLEGRGCDGPAVEDAALDRRRMEAIGGTCDEHARRSKTYVHAVGFNRAAIDETVVVVECRDDLGEVIVVVVVEIVDDRFAHAAKHDGVARGAVEGADGDSRGRAERVDRAAGAVLVEILDDVLGVGCRIGHADGGAID